MDPTPHPPGSGAGRPLPSITDLVEQLIHDLGELVRSEGRLARAEMMQTFRRTLRGVLFIAVAGLFFLLAGIILIEALVVALATVIGPGWAALVVGLALAVVGLVLFLAGRGSLSRATLLPERTIDQISRDTRLAQEQL